MVPTSRVLLYLLTMLCRFLLASLCINAILSEPAISPKLRRLAELAKCQHLGDVYATVLDQMKVRWWGRSRLEMGALMWISNSERPLHTSELCHALGVELGSADLDVENVPTIRELVRRSLGLIKVEESSSTVRLIHPTLREYLSNNPSLFQSPHSMIAEVCLTYLNFRCVRELSPTLRSAPPTFPLVEYASCYWGTHMVKGEEAGRVTSLALGLLMGFEEHISSRLLWLHYYQNIYRLSPSIGKGNSTIRFTGLHGAASLGMREIVTALLAMKEWNINRGDIMGQTALAGAAVGGHEDVVKILLRLKGINPNAAEAGCGRTPLWWAAQHGDEGIVKLLLEREDIDPNTSDTLSGRTPLWWAAKAGHEGIVRLLLERVNINPNTPDTKYGRTPLWWAAKAGHERVVKLLLERDDTNPNTADTKYSRTPLLWAEMGRYEAIVELLLEREDPNPHTLGLGEEVLELAASREDAGVVQLLPQPRPSLPNPGDATEAPEHPPAACPSSSKPLPPAPRAPPVNLILSFVVISSLVFLIYLLAPIGLSLLAFSLWWFYS